LTAHAGDWGARFSGDWGWAPRSTFDSYFNNAGSDFKYKSNGIELGIAYKDWDVSGFMYTAKTKGFLNRGFAYKNSGPWGPLGETITLEPGVTLPEGAYIDPNGMRLIGLKAGRFFTLWRPSKLLRVGVPIHVGAAWDSKKATQVTYVVSRQAQQGGFGLTSKPVTTTVPASEVFKGDLTPYPIVDLGLGFKFRSASWAEVEVYLKADNPRFPILAWGMTFRKHRD
jgi:hypothetical protein